jgi:hypothetical protein
MLFLCTTRENILNAVYEDTWAISGMSPVICFTLGHNIPDFN